MDLQHLTGCLRGNLDSLSTRIREILRRCRSGRPTESVIAPSEVLCVDACGNSICCPHLVTSNPKGCDRALTICSRDSAWVHGSFVVFCTAEGTSHNGFVAALDCCDALRNLRINHHCEVSV